MRMLRLRAYYEPEQTAAAHLDRNLSEALAENKVFCVNYTPTPTRGVSKDVYQEYRKKEKKTELDYGGYMIINRFSMFREHRNPIQRLFRYVVCGIKEYQLGTKAKDIDLVFSSSTPPTQGMLSAMVAQKLSRKYGRKVPFVYNLQDIFPDSLITAKMTKQGSLVWKVGNKIANSTYRMADKIIVISQDFKDNLIKKGVTEEKIVIVPNWIDSNEVYPVLKSENPLFDRFGLAREYFYICYSGNIGHSQNIDLLLNAAHIIQNENENIVFLVIGEGAEKTYLCTEIEKRCLRNIKVFPFQPYEDIANVYSLGDVDLIISKKGTGGSSVPSKTWSIMAAERPIIASFDADSELADIIKELECGVCSDADDVEAFVNAINELYQEEDKRMLYGKNGRDYVEHFLSKEECTQKYIDIFMQESSKPINQKS